MNNDVDIYMMKYHIAFDENNKPTFSYYRERLIKEKKIISGKIGFMNIFL